MVIALLSAVLLLPLSLLAQENDPKTPKGEIPDGLKALKHPEASVRYKAARVLANLGPLAKFAIPELREALKDSNPWVRVKVAEALWKVEQPPANVILPTLLEGLKEKEPTLRAIVPSILATMGSKARGAVPALIEALGDKDLDVKMEVVLALGDLGKVAKDAAGPLLKMTSDEDFAILEPIVSASLGNLGSGATAVLVQALSDKDAKKRRVAAYALAQLGPDTKEAASAMCRALADSEPAVRASAARGLGRLSRVLLDDKTITGSLWDACSDKDELVRIQAALAVWRLTKQTGKISVLSAALAHDSYAIRTNACQALGEMGPAAKDASKALIEVLKDPEVSVRVQAVLALGKIGPGAKDALPALNSALKDKDAGLALAAGFVVWQISGKTEDVLPILEKHLAGNDDTARRRAVELAGEIGPAAGPLVPRLVEAFQDDNAGFRQAVARAVMKIDAKAAAAAGIR